MTLVSFAPKYFTEIACIDPVDELERLQDYSSASPRRCALVRLQGLTTRQETLRISLVVKAYRETH